MLRFSHPDLAVRLVAVPRRATLFFLLISISAPAFAWSPEGHQAVADVARSRLTTTTRSHIRELLGNDDLAAISTWADEVRPQRPETFGWHFVAIPLNAGGFSEERDCYRPDEKHPETEADHHNCVVDRIEIFERILADKNESQAKRVEALKFLVHFVADIHQPLHAIAEARGGNDIHVTEFGVVAMRERSVQSSFRVGHRPHRARYSLGRSALRPAQLPSSPRECDPSP
jgi:hypothetical protein